VQVLLDNNCDRYDVVNINFLLLFFTIVVVVSFVADKVSEQFLNGTSAHNRPFQWHVADKGLLTSMAYIQTTVPPSPKATIKN